MKFVHIETFNKNKLCNKSFKQFVLKIKGFYMYYFLILFSLILAQQNIYREKQSIKEKIIKEIYYDYHHLKALSERQTVKVVYAPDITPHSFPSWPYNYVYGRDTLLNEANYYFSTNHKDYKKSYYYPIHIKVKKDTLIRFIEQVGELKTEYMKDGRKSFEELKITNYDHYNRRDRDSGIGIIINQISNKTSTKRKKYSYNNYPSYDCYIYNKYHPKYSVYYPFLPVNDSTLHSIRFTYETDKISYLSKRVNFHYGLFNIDGQKKSFITQIKHDNKDRYFNLRNIATSKNESFESKFNIPKITPTRSREDCLYQEQCMPDSLFFFTDSLGRTVKRYKFYVYDDCSFGGYANTDSIFNSQGQLVIEKPGYHSNGTKMGPPYSIKEYKYHNNGQIAEIISDGNIAREVYNENGKILIREYLGYGSNKDIYEYDKHDNLILFIDGENHDGNDDTYMIKYEHIYNDKNLLIETYIYYQPDPSWKQGNSNFTTRLVDDNNLSKYLIYKYKYNQYNQLIIKEEYMKDRGIIPSFNLGKLCSEFNADSCIHYGLLYKITNYEYEFYK